ncbi:tetratricopeptide repeat protein [Algoriphagus pacificus]|uniref:Tetratricopeptide repeat protein n=1 Tax=Algoriphagus pacificus TaxID=2811234 RepID=A0ABS3CJX1_9BACT|nr:tetratricopeptide repeat protein [Algoriphagus pacificus]MBN7817352.1 tetratricopeptide repeat protein [Algoriphagus pacificus]
MNKTKLLLSISLIFILSSTFAQNEKVQKLVSEGIEFHDQGNYKKAIETYKKALKVDENSSLANYEIALSYISTKDLKNSIAHAKKVIELNENHLIEAYVLWGNALDMDGKPEKAIEVYEVAMKEFDNHLINYNYAVTCTNVGEIDKAYDALLDGISINPSHGSSHMLLSQIMTMKGSRIKTILPLYFFLLLEPDSNRSRSEYQKLRDLLSQGISKKSEKDIDINIAFSGGDDSDFDAAELMISLSAVSGTLEENEEKSELELFSEQNELIFKTLGELKKENTGLFWELYVALFSDMANAGFTKPFSYYISQTSGPEVQDWLNNNEEEFQKFLDWINN